VFAIVADREEAEALAGQVRRRFGELGVAEVVIAAPHNRGATVYQEN
jgi:hypothetical protein